MFLNHLFLVTLLMRRQVYQRLKANLVNEETVPRWYQQQPSADLLPSYFPFLALFSFWDLAFCCVSSLHDASSFSLIWLFPPLPLVGVSLPFLRQSHQT